MFDTEFDYDYAPSQIGIQLPYEDAWVDTGTFKLFISAELDGVQNFVSECGWWIGKIKVVKTEHARYLDWIYAYSLVFDDELGQ